MSYSQVHAVEDVQVLSDSNQHRPVLAITPLLEELPHFANQGWFDSRLIERVSRVQEYW